MKLRGAIFDMDGTLIDSLMFWDDFWRRIGTRYMQDPEFRPCDEVAKGVRTMVFSDAVTFFLGHYCPGVDPDEFLAFSVSGITEFYQRVATVKPGAVALLDFLKARGIPLCVASATAKQELCAALEYHGLLAYFDAVLSCADIGIGKDRPDIYLMAAETMGVPSTEVLVFEDSPLALETAKRAGFGTVGIYDRYNPGQDRVRGASDLYLDEGLALDSLIPSLPV